MKRRDCNEVFNVEALEIRVLLPSLCQKVKIDKAGVSVFFKPVLQPCTPKEEIGESGSLLIFLSGCLCD